MSQASDRRTDHQIINVFESGRILGFALDFPVDSATLEVKDVLEVVCISESEGVLHQHDVYSSHLARPHCKDTHYLGQNTLRIILVMSGELG